MLRYTKNSLYNVDFTAYFENRGDDSRWIKTNANNAGCSKKCLLQANIQVIQHRKETHLRKRKLHVDSFTEFLHEKIS